MRRKKTARKKSLKGKLLVWFLIFALAPLGALAYFSSQSFIKTLAEHEMTNYRAASQLLGKNLADFLGNTARAVAMLAEDATLSANNVPSQKKLRKLEKLVSENPLYLAASLTDSEGKIAIDTQGVGIGQDVSGRDWYQEAVKRKDVVITDLIQSQRFKTWAIDIAAPVFNELGMFSGVLVLYLDLGNLYKELTKGVDFGDGYLYVYCAKHNDLILHPDPSLIGKTLDELGMGHLKAELSKQEGSIRYTFQGLDAVAVFTTVPESGLFSGENYKNWRVVGKVDYATILAPAKQVLNLVYVLIAVVALVVIFISLWISNSIAKPIARVTEALERVKEGDLTVQIEKAKSRDEIGRLSEALSATVESLRSMTQEILTTSSSLASSSEELSASVEEISKATQEIAQTIAQVAEGSTRQSEELQKVSEEAAQIGERAQRVAEATQRNLELLEKMQENLQKNQQALDQITEVMQKTKEEGTTTKEEAQKGKESLHKLIENVSSIARVSEEVAGSIQVLNERSQEIGKIVDLITGIAEQTNLLALNAAIEAARAGDAGRGFAVVAEEVRKLAEESAQAAEQIGKLIAEIQKDTHSAVESMQKAQSEVEAGSRESEQVAQNFNSILSAIERLERNIENLSQSLLEAQRAQEETTSSAQEVVKLSEESASLTAQATEGVRQIAEDLASVAAVAEENAASSEEVSASTEEQNASLEEVNSSVEQLAQMAQKLQKLVERFRI
ncbi:methyl-accepting chemotaxis protein [Thermatribacter velox]|uniref:Methyl-accepting chemotaxis protein n=1 Tax=Thermatribacter velox TaxID=3039681 RepID=A0ABZ2Y9A2_9BACT